MATHRSVPQSMPAGLRWPWLLVALAWATAILAAVSGWSILLDHRFLLEESGLPWPAAAIVFLICWQVMIAAMMVPVGLPGHSGEWALTRDAAARFLGGYALVWTAFEVLAFTGDTLIHRLVDAWPWLAGHPFVIGASTFSAAGLFQFSGWKRTRLAECRLPRATRGRHVWDDGVGYGCVSVGCCWALMLVMFGVGVGGLGWMVALTAAMLSETYTPRAWRVRQIIGIALLALAALWLAHPAWLMPAAT